MNTPKKMTMIFLLICITIFNLRCITSESTNIEEIQTNFSPLASTNYSLSWIQSFPAYQWDAFERASPGVADINRDGIIEIVMNYGIMYSINGRNGLILNSYGSYPNFYCSSPVIADIDYDNQSEIVTGTGGNQLYAMKGNTWGLKWQSTAFTSGLQTTAAIGDVDHDGVMEIFMGCNDNNFYCIDGETGTNRWVTPLYGMIMSNPALGDVDNDSVVEVIYGDQSKRIFCLSASTGVIEWQYNSNSQYVYNSPIIADLNSDGIGEILFLIDNGQKVCCLNGKTGLPIWTTSSIGSISASIRVGDIDFDLNEEVIVGVGNKVVILNGQSGALEKQTTLSITSIQSLVLANVDTDESCEIVCGCSNGIAIYDVDTSSTEWTYAINNATKSAITVANVDDDPTAEILYSSEEPKMYCFKTSGVSNYNFSWPCHGQNIQHGSFYKGVNWSNAITPRNSTKPFNQSNNSNSSDNNNDSPNEMENPFPEIDGFPIEQLLMISGFYISGTYISLKYKKKNN